MRAVALEGTIPQSHESACLSTQVVTGSNQVVELELPFLWHYLIDFPRYYLKAVLVIAEYVAQGLVAIHTLKSRHMKASPL